MKCSFCGSRAVFYAAHFGKFFCEKHLERYLLKKLKREIYRNGLVSPGDRILFISDGSPASEAELYLLSRVVRGWPVTIRAVSLNDFVDRWAGEEFTVTVDPVTVECEVSRALYGLASGRIYPAGYRLNSVIRPFRKFSAKELAALAISRGFRFREFPAGKLTGEGWAANLNFLRAFDSIMDLLRQQQGKMQARGMTRRKL